MKEYFHVLQDSPLFYHIDEADYGALLACLGARIESFDKKYTIMAEGSSPKFVGILLRGSAQIVRVDFYGNRTIVAGIAPSEVFGEAFACAELPMLPVDIVANEPCEVMLIDCNRLMHSCTNTCGFHQQLIFNLMKDLASKNVQFHQKVEVTSKRTTREKLMAYLMIQAQKAGSRSFEIPFDRQELADYLEVERSGLSAELSKLRKEKVLICRKNKFELL